MVKIVFALRRLPGLTPEEFGHHWRERHAPLVRRHAAALCIRRYEQSHPADPAISRTLAGVRGAPPPFDGVATLWFDSVADIAAAAQTPAGRQAARELLDDERRFIDLANSPITLVTGLTVPLDGR